VHRGQHGLVRPHLPASYLSPVKLAERFAVRNSGAIAVVEGAASMLRYMTGRNCGDFGPWAQFWFRGMDRRRSHTFASRNGKCSHIRIFLAHDSPRAREFLPRTL